MFQLFCSCFLVLHFVLSDAQSSSCTDLERHETCLSSELFVSLQTTILRQAASIQKLSHAVSEMEAVVQQHKSEIEYLKSVQNMCSPSHTATVSVSASSTISVSATASISGSSSPSPSPSRSSSESTTASTSPTSSVSATSVASASATVSSTSSNSATISSSPSNSATTSESNTSSSSATVSGSSSATSSATATVTATKSSSTSATASNSATSSTSLSPTRSITPSTTASVSGSSSLSSSPTSSTSPTHSASNSATESSSSSVSPTTSSTASVSVTASLSDSMTATMSISATASVSITSSISASETKSPTPTSSSTPSGTTSASVSASTTRSTTGSTSASVSNTMSSSASATASTTASATSSASVSRTTSTSGTISTTATASASAAAVVGSSSSPSPSPTKVYTLALFGDNANNQIGDTTTTAASLPVNAYFTNPTTRSTSYAAGNSHSVAISEGTLYQWGKTYLGNNVTIASYTSPTSLATLAGVQTKSVCAGQWSTIILTTTNDIYSWGYNAFGQLGLGDKIARLVPEKMSSTVLGGATISKVSCGWFISGFLSSAGTVWMAGKGSLGEIGNGLTADASTPTQVTFSSFTTGEYVSDIALGADHTLVVTSSGRLFSWGLNANGQLGDGTTTTRNSPVAVSISSSLVMDMIGCGRYHCVARATSGAFYSWGDNTYGQLCDGTTTTPRSSPVSVVLTALSGVTFKTMDMGHQFTLMVADSGTLYGCGLKLYLGLGVTSTTDTQTTPTAITGGVLNGKSVRDVSAVYQHALVLYE
eukprot:c11495_g1_i1.p1 GENE.c11495_g1_i1~~c11495_g1_i1.p1  ORF type:complete len:774 (-),score=191.27 c11495_g1_i1:155-2476(-)